MQFCKGHNQCNGLLYCYRALDSSVQTSFFYHTRNWHDRTLHPYNLWVMASMFAQWESHLLPQHSNQNQQLKSSQSLGRYRSLLIMIIQVHNVEPWVSVDGIHNVPYAVKCVRVTNTIYGHDIICWSASKPTKGTCEADIRCTLSTSNVAWSTYSVQRSNDVWMKVRGETLECTVFYSICPSEVPLPSSL